MISCQHCGSENVRIQGQATLSAPGELMYKFSKSNLRRKDVYLMGVNWETCDIICGDCSRVTPAYGNYVSRMEKEVKKLTAELEKTRDQAIAEGRIVGKCNKLIEELEAELDKFHNGYKGACYACEPVGEQNEKLQAEVRDAHYAGYMAGMGDSEDYDPDPVVMEKEAWAEYKDEEE